MQGYDVIGDVHGCADELRALLAMLGSNPERKIIFLGDLIDRGPQQTETLDLVRNLMAEDKALCVMGNHEYNAIMRSLGLRTKQDLPHEIFLKQFPQGSSVYKEAIDWMKSLPVWLEFPQFAAVHACFHHGMMQTLSPYLDTAHRALSDELFSLSAKKEQGGDPLIYDALENILKGTELKLPDGYSFTDKENNVRREIRTKWWLEHPSSYREVCLTTPPEQIPDVKIPYREWNMSVPDKLVVVGHYWLRGKDEQAPELCESQLCENLVYCADFSCVKGGALCCLRIDLKDDSIEKLSLLSVPSTVNV